jgi:hypothetical protein
MMLDVQEKYGKERQILTIVPPESPPVFSINPFWRGGDPVNSMLDIKIGLTPEQKMG